VEVLLYEQQIFSLHLSVNVGECGVYAEVLLYEEYCSMRNIYYLFVDVGECGV
jgi:hypothetical protein